MPPLSDVEASVVLLLLLFELGAEPEFIQRLAQAGDGKPQPRYVPAHYAAPLT